ncbi:MAG: RDD family protein [Dissulfurispiraceae bacterium]|jgi:uncharacterized RDD family membrane protein YckC|nr:RDD family protein [Dissulfurispiraceae bacterium]
MIYAGFWVRAIAKLIDIIIVSSIYPLLSLMATIGFSTGKLQETVTTYEAFMSMICFFIIIQFVFAVLYFTISIGKYGKTIGKKICGLVVITAQGGKVQYFNALKRFAAEMLSTSLLLLGYLIVVFDSEKRALHDRLCNTRVIYNVTRLKSG